MFVSACITGTFLGLTLPIVLLLFTGEYAWVRSLADWHIADSGGHWHIEEAAPGAQLLLPHANTILQEFQRFKSNLAAAGHTLPPAHSIDPTQGSFYSQQHDKLQWSLLPLRLFSVDMPLQELFPEATRLLRSLPHAESMFLSILAAKSTISPHTGSVAAVQRCTIYIDTQGQDDCSKLPCSPHTHAHFKVMRHARNHSSPAQQDATVLHTTASTSFCFWDIQTHAAANPTEHDRVALLVDYSLPMSGLLARMSTNLVRIIAKWHPRLRGMHSRLRTIVDDVKSSP